MGNPVTSGTVRVMCNQLQDLLAAMYLTKHEINLVTIIVLLMHPLPKMRTKLLTASHDMLRRVLAGCRWCQLAGPKLN